MRRAVLMVAALYLALPAPADARRHPRHSRVVISVSPPAHRPAAVVGIAPGVGWVWVAGHPGRGGGWVNGHWIYKGTPPRPGWVYVEGYWRGTLWISGFWRPSTLVGFHWIEPRVDERGNYIPGYWEPDGPAPEGTIWRPGYWDGTRWVSGQWVKAESYTMYAADGSLQFFGYGDGEIESVTLTPEPEPNEIAVGAQEQPPESEGAAPPDVVAPSGEVRHSAPPVD